MNQLQAALAATACLLAFGGTTGCDQNKNPAAAKQVAVHSTPEKSASATGDEAAAQRVPSEEQLKRVAGKLHQDKPHPGALPAGHPEALPAGHPPIGGTAPAQPAASGTKGQVAKQVAEPVAKATGEGAKTVAEVNNQRAELSGKPVRVRGRVVKSNNGILGANWLHLQDGTGDESDSSHDITVTTQSTAKVGDVVTAAGVLATDKDFGSGYKYAAIIESAAISAE